MCAYACFSFCRLLEIYMKIDAHYKESGYVNQSTLPLLTGLILNVRTQASNIFVAKV